LEVACGKMPNSGLIQPQKGAVFMPKSVIVSVINHKGGVGKTSTVVNVAAGLALRKKRVLVIDLDTQMNLTHSLIGDLPEDELSICDVIISDKTPLAKIIKKTQIAGVDIAPSGESMVNLELQLHSAIGREFKLKRVLACSSELASYDYILIDNAPHVGLATVNSLMASEYFMVPVSSEYLPLVGLKHLLRTIDQIKPLHPGIKNLGYLLTMVDRREGISSDVEKILRETFLDEVFTNIVRVNTKLKACPQKRQSIFDAEKPGGRGYADYSQVTDEFLARLGRI
jgi:chromosome partitioning protein